MADNNTTHTLDLSSFELESEEHRTFIETVADQIEVIRRALLRVKRTPNGSTQSTNN